MLSEGFILETGYVIYNQNTNTYCTANAGLYKTKKGAQKECDRMNNMGYKNRKVIKVNLVVCEE